MGAVLVVKVALGVVLGLSIARAFFGAPPSRPMRGGTAAAVAGGLGYAAAMAETVRGATLTACVLLAVAVEALAVAVWIARGGDDGTDETCDPADGPPPDWAEFDRVRAGWTPPPRDRTPVA
jgi:hypothetical protein